MIRVGMYNPDTGDLTWNSSPGRFSKIFQIHGVYLSAKSRNQRFVYSMTFVSDFRNFQNGTIFLDSDETGQRGMIESMEYYRAERNKMNLAYM